MMDEVSDERIRGMQVNLTGMLQLSGDGFADHMIWKSELAMLLMEVMRYRDKPLHCPGCSGDHL